MYKWTANEVSMRRADHRVNMNEYHRGDHPLNLKYMELKRKYSSIVKIWLRRAKPTHKMYQFFKNVDRVMEKKVQITPGMLVSLEDTLANFFPIGSLELPDDKDDENNNIIVLSDESDAEDADIEVILPNLIPPAAPNKSTENNEEPCHSSSSSLCNAPKITEHTKAPEADAESAAAYCSILDESPKKTTPRSDSIEEFLSKVDKPKPAAVYAQPNKVTKERQTFTVNYKEKPKVQLPYDPREEVVKLSSFKQRFFENALLHCAPKQQQSIPTTKQELAGSKQQGQKMRERSKSVYVDRVETPQYEKKKPIQIPIEKTKRPIKRGSKAKQNKIPFPPKVTRNKSLAETAPSSQATTTTNFAFDDPEGLLVEVSAPAENQYKNFILKKRRMSHFN